MSQERFKPFSMLLVVGLVVVVFLMSGGVWTFARFKSVIESSVTHLEKKSELQRVGTEVDSDMTNVIKDESDFEEFDDFDVFGPSSPPTASQSSTSKLSNSIGLTIRDSDKIMNSLDDGSSDFSDFNFPDLLLK
jgi:FtsZ-interacting cell division protein ZipA